MGRGGGPAFYEFYSQNYIFFFNWLLTLWGSCFPYFSFLRTLFFPIFPGWCAMLRGVVCGHFLSANGARNRLLLQYTHPTVQLSIVQKQKWKVAKNSSLVLPCRLALQLSKKNVLFWLWAAAAMQASNGKVYKIQGDCPSLGGYHRFAFWKLPNIWNVWNLLYSTSKQWCQPQPTADQILAN